MIAASLPLPGEISSGGAVCGPGAEPEGAGRPLGPTWAFASWLGAPSGRCPGGRGPAASLSVLEAQVWVSALAGGPCEVGRWSVRCARFSVSFPPPKSCCLLWRNARAGRYGRGRGRKGRAHLQPERRGGRDPCSVRWVDIHRMLPLPLPPPQPFPWFLGNLGYFFNRMVLLWFRT